MLDNEVSGKVKPISSLPFIECVLLKDPVHVERPQDVQSVPLFVQSASRELTDKLRDSLLPLRPGASLEIGSFGESLMEAAMRSAEPDHSHRVPVLGDLHSEWPEEFQGLSERRYLHPTADHFESPSDPICTQTG